MKNIISSSFFTPILQYNRQNKEQINKICSPLKECFDIAYFGYLRFLNDGHYILISNCAAWIEGFSYDYVLNTKFFGMFPQYLSKYEPLRTIWPASMLDESIEFLKNKMVYNCFAIAQEKAGTLEYYFFGTDKYSLLFNNFYRSHLFCLEEFIFYFHKIAAELIDISDASRYGTSPYMRTNFHQIENVFNNISPWEEKIIKFKALLNSCISEEIHEVGKRNLLSSRELECLSHASTGLTAKEIARSLGIGYRTVETHLNNIRLKTGCETKRELTHWFEDKFRHLLIR